MKRGGDGFVPASYCRGPTRAGTKPSPPRSSRIRNRVELDACFLLARARLPILNNGMSIETPAGSTSNAIQSRREFLGRLSALAALGTIGGAGPRRASAGEPVSAGAQKTLVGSNIFGWGQYAQRDHKKLDVAEVIAALRDTGYDYLETLWTPRTPKQTPGSPSSSGPRASNPSASILGRGSTRPARPARWSPNSWPPPRSAGRPASS